MDKKALEARLARLKEELDDILEERHFMLEKTSIHVPGSARKYYDEQIKALKEKIKKCEAELQKSEEE